MSGWLSLNFLTTASWASFWAGSPPVPMPTNQVTVTGAALAGTTPCASMATVTIATAKRISLFAYLFISLLPHSVKKIGGQRLAVCLGWLRPILSLHHLLV